MGYKKFFKKLGKNMLVGLAGAGVGIAVAIFYVILFWVPVNAEKVGLGIIVLLPVMIILFSILGVIVGGILGIVGYWLVKILKKRHMVVNNVLNFL